MTVTPPIEPPPPESGDAINWRDELRELLETALLSLVIFLVVNALTGRYEVQSVSMEPTLHADQFVLVSKVSYRLHAPQRGDIIVFDPPQHRSEIPYVKRIIGLPGEHVAVHSGRVWINGIAINEPYISGPPTYQDERTLGADEYFVLGDNRNNSSDSHVWGPLPKENIIGKVVLRYWPPEKWAVFSRYTYPELEGSP